MLKITNLKIPRWLPALTLALASALQPSGALSEEGMGVSATMHGVTVALVVDGSTTSYPRNALVQAQVSVHNDSGTVVNIPSSCDNNSPGLEVLRHDRVGDARFDTTRVYPPGILEPQGACLPVLQRVEPGGILQVHVPVVLFGAYVRAFAPIDTDTGESVITTPQLYFHLFPPKPPRVVVHAKPRVSAGVRRPPGVTGPLLYLSYSVCPLRGGSRRITNVDWRSWTPATGTTLTPACARPTTWEVLAGWQGSSVARIVYPPRQQ